MGHSRITNTKAGKLNQSEVNELYSNLYDEERFENGNRAGFGDDPKIKSYSTVYSESEADSITNSLDGYESVALYYIPNAVWLSHFKSNEKQIQKLRENAKKKQSDLSLLEKSAVEKFNKKKSATFFSCDKCKSKVNVSAVMIRRTSPSNCPICFDTNQDKFTTTWNEKVFGKGFSAKKQKLQNDIKEIQVKIQALENARPKESNIADLPKKLQAEIRTMVAVDVHH